MKLSNGHGLTYEILKHRRSAKNEDGKVTRSFVLRDPHTGETFKLTDMTEARLKMLGYKVVK